MTEKEKANELGNKFYEGSVFDKSKEEHILECERAKKRAIIAVDEIIKNNIEDWISTDYWQEVKQELEKL